MKTVKKKLDYGELFLFCSLFVLWVMVLPTLALCVFNIYNTYDSARASSLTKGACCGNNLFSEVQVLSSDAHEAGNNATSSLDSLELQLLQLREKLVLDLPEEGNGTAAEEGNATIDHGIHESMPTGSKLSDSSSISSAVIDTHENCTTLHEECKVATSTTDKIGYDSGPVQFSLCSTPGIDFDQLGMVVTDVQCYFNRFQQGANHSRPTGSTLIYADGVWACQCNVLLPNSTSEFSSFWCNIDAILCPIEVVVMRSVA